MALLRRGNVLRTQDLIAAHLRILEGLQYGSGLFAASSKNVSTGYDKAWLRDNFYECLAFQALGEWNVVHRTCRAILNIIEKHEEKIDWAIRRKPQHKHEYIHARYHPETFAEFWEEWGNKQNDAVGALLFLFGELERHGKSVIVDDRDKRLAQKLVDYLGTLRYFDDPDSGVWEEDEEVHASSVGACVAGLRSVRAVKGIVVPDALIMNGEKTLRHMLPRESPGKFVDLALLSLIWPYAVVTPEERTQIVQNVEYHLLRARGVIRYKNDHYYNKNPDGYSEEAEWCFGIAWLAIVHERIGDKEKGLEYVKQLIGTIDEDGHVPELYFSNSAVHNTNSPLGWAESLFIVALHLLNEKTISLDIAAEKKK